MDKARIAVAEMQGKIQDATAGDAKVAIKLIINIVKGFLGMETGNNSIAEDDEHFKNSQKSQKEKDLDAMDSALENSLKSVDLDNIDLASQGVKNSHSTAPPPNNLKNDNFQQL